MLYICRLHQGLGYAMIPCAARLAAQGIVASYLRSLYPLSLAFATDNKSHAVQSRQTASCVRNSA